MNIEIITIPHSLQRYETAGDWFFEGNTLRIHVSDVGDWRYEMLVAFHEMAEAFMCKHKGITEESITDFDERFEMMRKEFPEIVADAEPGNNGQAPYRKQHQFATDLERRLASRLDVNWEEYDKVINNLSKDGN